MPPKKPITSADLDAVIRSTAAGARQALSKGDLNGASVAMLTLSMAVANPSVGGFASGAAISAGAAASAVPAAAEVLSAALDRALPGGKEEEKEKKSDDAFRAAVEASSIAAGALSALLFVENEGRRGDGESRGASATPHDVALLSSLSSKLLGKVGQELASSSSSPSLPPPSSSLSSKSSSSNSNGNNNNNPWTATGTINNAASFAAALFEAVPAAAAGEEEKDDKRKKNDNNGDDVVVVSPEALSSILDAAAAASSSSSSPSGEDGKLGIIAVELACSVASHSDASAEALASWRKGKGNGSDGGSSSSSSSSTSVVAALGRLLGSFSPSVRSSPPPPDFNEIRIRNLMALAMTMAAEKRLDEAGRASPPGAAARSALVGAPGAAAALVAAMKQSEDSDAKAVARGLFSEVAEAEDSKASVLAALEGAGKGRGGDKGGGVALV